MTAETCCAYRRKILVAVQGVLSEEACGVPDAVLADLLRFDLNVPSGKPVLAFRFCPWCGKVYTQDSEVRLSDINPEAEVEQSYAKCSVCERGFEADARQTPPVCPDCM